jgi:hypothetical protein
VSRRKPAPKPERRSTAILTSVVGQLFAHLADNKFGKELPADLPRLFAEHAARVVPNDESEYAAPRPFEHAVATIVTPDLRLRIVRSPGGFSIEIAAPAQPRDWRPLESLLDTPPGLDWPSVDRFLSDHWQRLRA